MPSIRRAAHPVHRAAALLRLVPFLVLGIAAPARAREIQLVAADELGVTLKLDVGPWTLGPPGEDGRRDISVPPLDILDMPGRPRLPFATAMIALPAGAGASVSVIGEGAEEIVEGVRLSIGSRPIIRTDPDFLGYVPAREPADPILDGAWPPTPAEVNDPFAVRRQNVTVVQLMPFRYDPATGRLWTRRTLTVRVSFTGARSRPSPLGAPAEDKGWESVLRTTLLNYEQGRPWREPRPALGRGLFDRAQGMRAALPGGQAAAAFDEGEPEVRVRIDTTGVWALDATELLARDYPADVPIAEVSVHRHEFVENMLAPNPPYVTFEIPVEVDDVDGDGTLTAGDRVVLFAQSWWERSGLAYATPTSFAQRNWGDADYVYVTRVRPPHAAGLRIPQRSGWSALSLTPLASYPYRQRWELNTNYLGQPRDTTQDAFTWIQRPNFANPVQLPFEIFDLDTTVSARFGATWTGMFDNSNHFVWIAVKNSSGQQTSIADNAITIGKSTVTRSAQIFGSALSDGPLNRFVIWGQSTSDNRFPHIALGSFDAIYQRHYRAIRGYLSCNSGDATGDYEIFATGFSDSASIRVYDVTDSTAVRRLIATPKEPAGSGYGVRFQDNTAPGVRKRYLVCDAPRQPSSAAYAKVDGAAITNLYDRPAGDYLLIVPEAFAGAVGPLTALRRSQGLDVVVSPLEAVNDAFNGGRKSPYAIKRFIKYAYDNWDARFVLLVGDGSQDPQLVSPQSSLDWVPTQRIMGPVLATGTEESFFEPIVSDPWYVWCVDCASTFNKPLLPDLHIGRLPVNSLTQASAVVSKLVSYENVHPDSLWRRKMVLVADDQYSGNNFGQIENASTYCRQNGELVFKKINQRIRSIIADQDSAGLGQSEPELFNLADYLQPHTAADTAACSPPGVSCRCNGQSFITKARATAMPALFSRLAEGRLWFNYQGHANKRVLSHEGFYANSYVGYGDDKDLLQNYGRPFIFTAFSCHPNEFGNFQENGVTNGGPSIGEDLVNLPSRGAIASWASSGFELLPTDEARHVNVEFARSLFLDPPREPQAFDPEGGARVLLGEVISKAELDYYPGPRFSLYERDVAISYNLLGDPATRVSIGAPQAIFRANGTPVTDGVPVRLFTIGDSLRIEGDVVSNARIDTVWVERIEGASTIAIAATDSLTPNFPDTTDASHGGRRYHIVFRTRLTVGTYTYRFRSMDRYGVPGTFDAVFRFETQLSAEGGIVRNGDVVGPNAQLSFLLLSPSPLVPATDIKLFLNGQQLSITATPANNDLSGREWILTWNYGTYPDGNYRLDLDVLNARAATHTFAVQSRLAIQNPLAFPNPFNDERGTVFSFYLESDRPSNLLLRVYTISGRMIYERTSKGAPAGYQQIPWNGLDAEGRSLANGVYFYRLAADNGASSTRYEGRLVKLTKPTHIPEEQVP